MRRLETKYIFKQAVHGVLPDKILKRPKQGFGVPIQEWIDNELRSRIRETITSTRAPARLA